MNELDLQPLIDAAVILDQEDREIRDCENMAATIGDGVSSATPSSLEKRLVDLHRLSDRSGNARWTTPALWEKLHDRICRQRDHHEIMALMGNLLKQAHDLKGRLVRLRRRVRDMEMVLVGATKDLQAQTLDSRLLRLVADEYRSMTLAEIHDAVEKDHEAVADAMAAWRLSHGNVVVLSIRDSSTVEEVLDALRRLERTGHAARNGPLFGMTRWKVRSVPRDDRMRA